MKKRAFFNWSSGKDSAFALYRALKSDSYDIAALFTVTNKNTDRVSMHEVSTDLLKRQASCIGMPLKILELDPAAPFSEYEQNMARCMADFKSQNIETALFGDIYLEDLRNYRENSCRKAGLNAEFPLWGEKPEELIRDFINSGFKTVITCVAENALGEEYVGRVIDNEFVNEISAAADVCGENGEYHSFVFDGPIFEKPVPFKALGRYFCDYYDGETRQTSRYWYLNIE